MVKRTAQGPIASSRAPQVRVRLVAKTSDAADLSVPADAIGLNADHYAEVIQAVIITTATPGLTDVEWHLRWQWRKGQQWPAYPISRR